MYICWVILSSTRPFIHPSSLNYLVSSLFLIHVCLSFIGVNWSYDFTVSPELLEFIAILEPFFTLFPSPWRGEEKQPFFPDGYCLKLANMRGTSTPWNCQVDGAKWFSFLQPFCPSSLPQTTKLDNNCRY